MRDVHEDEEGRVWMRWMLKLVGRDAWVEDVIRTVQEHGNKAEGIPVSMECNDDGAFNDGGRIRRCALLEEIPLSLTRVGMGCGRRDGSERSFFESKELWVQVVDGEEI